MVEDKDNSPRFPEGNAHNRELPNLGSLFNRLRSNLGAFLPRSQEREIPEILQDESFMSEVRGVWQDLLDEEGKFNPPVELFALMEMPKVLYETRVLLDPQFVEFVPVLMKLSEDEYENLTQTGSLPETDEFTEELFQRELDPNLQNLPTFKKTLMHISFIDMLAMRLGFNSAEEMVRHDQENAGRNLLNIIGKQGDSLEDALKVYQIPDSTAKSLGNLLILGSFYAAYMRMTFRDQLPHIMFSPDEMNLAGLERMKGLESIMGAPIQSQTEDRPAVSLEDIGQEFSEVQDAILRMRSDITRQPARIHEGGGEYKNYFHQETVRGLQSGMSDEFIVGSVATLVRFKMPELISMYKMITKNTFLPQSSEEFLAPMSQAKQWTLDRSGVSVKDVENIREFFRPAEPETETTQKIWIYLLAQVIDIIQSGLRRNLDRMVAEGRGFYGDRNVAKSRIFGNLVSGALGAYVHPDTLKAIEMALRGT